jgi:hypothetical protein
MFGRMNRVHAGVLLLVVVGALPITGATAPLATGTTDAPPGAAIEADSVEFRITVFDNASSRWTFTYTRVLENETERRQFESFAEEFEANETQSFIDFRDLAKGLADRGRNATGREMRAKAFSRSASLGGNCVTRDCGTVTMSFIWTSFAVEDGEQLVVGDVFGTGLYISSDMELVVETGQGLAFQSASPKTYNDPDTSLDERQSITYKGEKSFADRRPRVVFVPIDEGTASPTAGGAGTTESPTPGASPSPTQGSELPMALLGGLALIVGSAAAFAWWRRDGRGGVLPVDSAGGDGGVGATVDDADIRGAPSVPEEELLTDEDRVTSLLEDNGGRMKQVDIVEETGWSKSKVSMLLSDMEDDDEISKLRVGRENIISLAGHEPEAAGSPHEEN